MTHHVTSPPSIAALRKDHSITSSAMENSPDGTSVPSARAGLKVDGELELGRLQHRQIGRLGALRRRRPVRKNECQGCCGPHQLNL